MSGGTTYALWTAVVAALFGLMIAMEERGDGWKAKLRGFAMRLTSPNKQTDWHFYQRGLDLMRRSDADGKWEYRAMTDEEHRRYIADRW